MSDTVPTPATEQSGKTFTEAQVEQIVKERLTRDREARKTEADTKAEEFRAQAEKAQAELASATARIEALQGTSATAEEIATKVDASYAEIEKAIPEDKRKMIPAKYSAAEKIEYIAQNRGLFFPDQTVPPVTTAAPAVTNDGKGPAEFGGFGSELEFAQRNPQGYLAAKKAGKV